MSLGDETMLAWGIVLGELESGKQFNWETNEWPT